MAQDKAQCQSSVMRSQTFGFYVHRKNVLIKQQLLQKKCLWIVRHGLTIILLRDPTQQTTIISYTHEDGSKIKFRNAVRTQNNIFS